MRLVIATETPLQDDVRLLVAALNAHLSPLSPKEFQFQMSVEQMAGADTTVFVARLDGEAVGVGALKVYDAALGEVKRMYTVPKVRGQRVGSAILGAIEHEAKRKGLRTLLLETGAGAGFEGAHRLYSRSGFTPRGAFFDYPDSGHSAFFEKHLAAKSAA